MSIVFLFDIFLLFLSGSCEVVKFYRFILLFLFLFMGNVLWLVW